MSKTPATPGDHDPDSRMNSKSESTNPSPETWSQVFADAEPGLRKFLRGKLSQPADVDDCLQAVSIAMIKNQKPIPPAVRKAWLYRVAANEAALWWRHHAADQRARQRHAETHLADRSSESTFDTLENKETHHQMIQAVARLPESMRRVLHLRLSQSLTFQEIANQLGMPLGTVLTQMRRATQRLRDELDDDTL